jgi:RNA polymerase-binding transcription factor DksA
MRDETPAATDSTEAAGEPAVPNDPRHDGQADEPVATIPTSVIDDAEATLADVESALERLESGQYGTCEICNAVIEPAILASSPVARRCGLHSI